MESTAADEEVDSRSEPSVSPLADTWSPTPCSPPKWQNAGIVSGDVANSLNNIKSQDGGDITMSGSATTACWLLREGILDELNLLVHPMVVGDGMARLFPTR